MATVVIIGILAFIAYELAIFNHYQKEPPHGGKQANSETEVSPKVEDADIIGKSSFNMKAEMERMRQRQEEAKRKEAVAKGEMTEDGKEIAKPVNPEDCEFEQKKVWKQVPTEQLNNLFDEPDEPEESYAEGATIDDIDLAFKNVGRKDMSEEEERSVVKVFKGLEGTELFDTITKDFPHIGDCINDLFDKYENKPMEDAVSDKNNIKVEPKETFSIPERFEDFNIHDYV